MLKYRLRRLRKSFQSKPRTSSLTYKKINIAVEQKSTHIINLVGYVMLFLVLLDYAFLLASKQVFEPGFAYSTGGNLVEKVWGLLLGFLLIFYRRDQDLIKPAEFRLLSFLSWFVLVIGISYFLIIPIIVGNAVRIHRLEQAQMMNQVNVQKSQVQQYSQQLNQASPKQLDDLLQNYQQTTDLKVTSVQQLKSNLLDQAKQKQAATKQELLTKFSQQKTSLFKTTVKWSIGAIISGVCFILIWKHTNWTRAKSKILN
ncbi:HpsJ-like protein, cyanoexosortase A-associated [Pleurocapsa sp. FMAR1]|uniref:HpsJ-like protein, cyanoexosortase A-associated n=1 Tax=Pleurocapsa sp. FMAR1 TaxID=3040204 RepID=UPI0029C6935D|nr:HpsJ family protein [Pleurocapsa sp. FMAR1]